MNSYAAASDRDGPRHRRTHRAAGLLAATGGVLLFAIGCYRESIPHVDGIEVSLSEENFDQEVLQSKIPVLVEFGADWCGPCREMDPVVALLSEDYEGLMKVGKVDVDNSPRLALRFDVEGLPTFVLFRSGDVVERNVGSQGYRSMRKWLERLVGTPDSSAVTPDSSAM